MNPNDLALEYGKNLCCLVNPVLMCKCGWQLCADCMSPLYYADSKNHPRQYNRIGDHECPEGGGNAPPWVKGHSAADMKPLREP